MNAPTPTRTGPSIKRGASKQDYQTPPELLDAIAERFGPIAFDLAATRANCVVGSGSPRAADNVYFGPDHEKPELRDSLKQDWSALRGVAYCNPPFDPIAPWMKQAAKARDRQGWTLVLAPVGTGSNWYEEHVKGKAFVLFLNGRVKFIGAAQGYPKDLLLACFGWGVVGSDTWRWDASKKWRVKR